MAGASLLIATGACFLVRDAAAHEGPPYPIFMDEPTPSHLVSVWADPDVGTGTFFVLLEARNPSAADEDLTVEVWVQPTNRRLSKATYPAEERQLRRHRIQFVAEPKFDRQEMWTVGIILRPAGGEPAELITEVEVTPPGLGIWSLFLSLFPFIALGGLWIYGMLRRRRELAKL